MDVQKTVHKQSNSSDQSACATVNNTSTATISANCTSVSGNARTTDFRKYNRRERDNPFQSQKKNYLHRTEYTPHYSSRRSDNQNNRTSNRYNYECSKKYFSEHSTKERHDPSHYHWRSHIHTKSHIISKIQEYVHKPRRNCHDRKLEDRSDNHTRLASRRNDQNTKTQEHKWEGNTHRHKKSKTPEISKTDKTGDVSQNQSNKERKNVDSVKTSDILEANINCQVDNSDEKIQSKTQELDDLLVQKNHHQKRSKNLLNSPEQKYTTVVKLKTANNNSPENNNETVINLKDSKYFDNSSEQKSTRPVPSTASICLNNDSKQENIKVVQPKEHCTSEKKQRRSQELTTSSTINKSDVTDKSVATILPITPFDELVTAVSVESNDLRFKINDTPKPPKISLIPLSKLLRNELLDLTKNQKESDISSFFSVGKNIAKPNLVVRRRKHSCGGNSGSATDTLIEKVASMDKMGIQNVINSSGTKYDEALKMQARKRLHDEIRKQLKSMNLETPKTIGSAEFVPDDIVDSIHIPDVVLDEIRKAFGIEIFELESNTTSQCSDVVAEPNSTTATDIGGTETENHARNNLNTSETVPNTSTIEYPLTKMQLQTETTRSEESKRNLSESEIQTKNKNYNQNSKLKSKHDLQRRSEGIQRIHFASTKKKKKRKKSLCKSPKCKQSSEIIVLSSTSSSSSSSSSSTSSSSSSSSSSDSDTDSNCSEKSDTSSVKRRKRKQKIDAENIMASFEKLVLPSLTESLIKRYQTKYSCSTYSKLHFISCICGSDYNSEKFSKIEIAKIQQNLKSANKSVALDFLMREIVHVFNKQKSVAKTDSRTETVKPQTCNKNSMLNNEKNESNRIVSENRKNIVEIDEPELVETAVKTKSANAAEKCTATTKSVMTSNTNCDEDMSAAIQSTPTKHQSANEQTSIEKNAGYAKVINEINKSLNSIEKAAANCLCSNDRAQTNRLGSGVGASTWPSFPLSDYSTSFPNISGVNDISTLCSSSVEMANFPPIDLDALKKQSVLGEAIVNNLREIDLKLMELHKRKIYIEEMLLRLQKDKMEAELHTVKLQNEKFILLNSAMTANAATVAIKAEPASNDIKLKSEDSSDSSNSNIKLRRSRRNKVSHRRQINSMTSSAAKRTRTDFIILDLSSGTDNEIWSHSPSLTHSKHIESSDSKEPETTTTKSYDYKQIPNGYLVGIKSPISQICVLDHLAIAGAEDGTLYKFNLITLQLEKQFNKHSEAITQMYLCSDKNILYTTSLDGYFKKSSIENFELDIQSLYLQEPLQSIDVQWGVAYIGSRWGNIFTFDITTNQLGNAMLCSTSASIQAIKATKEGPRKVLIISSKGNMVQFRDATNGLLLRTLDVPEQLHVYSLLLDYGNIYCGTQYKEVLKFDFTSGVHRSSLPCGNGAVSMKAYNNKYILVGCYDGYIYVLDKITEKQVGRFPGSGKMVLAMEIMGNKIITSSKNKTMKIIEFPNFDVPSSSTYLDTNSFC